MRKAIGKRLRFDVFKRDGFVCQYCGAHPPAVVLQVDHIKPVASGGQNTIDNLVTSCQPCNIGKGAVELSSVPQSLADKAAMVAEQQAQIRGYEKVFSDARKRVTSQAKEIADLYELMTDGYKLTEKELVSVRLFISKLSFDTVFLAMERACVLPKVGKRYAFKYFCGTCWGKIKEAQK